MAKDIFPLEAVPFADVAALEKALQDVELGGRLVTSLSLGKDNSTPPRFVEGYQFTLPPDQQPPPIIAHQVIVKNPDDKDEYLAFLAPLLTKATMFARGDMLVGGKTIDVVLLRAAPEIVFPSTNGILRGDGTWPWVAKIVGDDIVVENAKTTCFGGADDPQDNGETASGVSTKKNPGLQACSLPMRYSGANQKLLEALGGSPIPKMPFGLKADGTVNPGGIQVEVIDPNTNTKITVPVVDIGPAKKTGHPLDLTEAAARQFNLNATAKNFSMRLNFRIIGGKKFVPDSEITGVPQFAAADAKLAGTFIQKLVASAQGEFDLVQQTNETSEPLRSQIQKYWTEIGLVFPGVSTAWSAVFISWNVKQAGATAANFKFSARHSEFVNAAINQAGQAFKGRKVGEYAPKVGDIIQNNRNGNHFDFAHAASNSSYESHSAIVVEVGVLPKGNRFAVTIGGNENDSVRRTTINLDGDGKLIQPEANHFICVLENLAG